MRAAILAAAIFLPCCAAITSALAPPYEPKPIRVYDAAQFAADLAECKLAGASWVPHFSLGKVASRTVDGATSNASLIPVSPLVPFYGAAGGAASATADGLDIASREHAAVFKNCLHDETQIDKSAVVADPRER